MSHGRTVLVRAPSNIALIKYMGKKDLPGNIPENGSISITLDSLCTYVEITKNPSATEQEAFIPALPRIPAGEIRGNPQIPVLSAKGADRALRHLTRVRSEAPAILERFGIHTTRSPADWELRSANTFPAASGIASSASSFAGITLATAYALADDPAAFKRHWNTSGAFRAALARLARAGSGSSCRSLQGPWVAWENEDTELLDSRALPALSHFVLLVSEKAKAVSSSEAHQRVKTSPLWDGRVSRVKEKLASLRIALKEGDLDEIARITWREAWEMHSLFHTSSEPFSYWTQDTVKLLQWLSPFVAGEHPPIVTLDAGPNVHVLVPESEANEWARKLHEEFPEIPFLRDRPGQGAELIATAEGISE